MTRKLKESKTLLYEEMKELGMFGLLRRLRRTSFWKAFLFFNPLHLIDSWFHHSTVATFVKAS